MPIDEPTTSGGEGAGDVHKLSLDDARLNVRNAMITVIAVIVVLGALWFAELLMVSLVLAVLGAYMLDPLVRLFQRAHLPRALAAAAVMLLLLAGLGYSAYALSDEVSTAIRQFPEATDKLRRELRSWKGDGDSAVVKLSEAAKDLEASANELTGPKTASEATPVQVVEPSLDLRRIILGGSKSLAALSGQIVTLGFLTYFLLASGDLFRRKLVRLAGPALATRRITVQILDDIHRSIEAFVTVMAATNAALGVGTWLAFSALGVQAAPLWGIAAALLNTIPYVGSSMVLVASMAAALVQFGSISQMLLVGGVFLILTSLEGLLLKPYMMSRRGKLNTPAVLVSLLFWGWLWGMWGLLLAFPILMVVKTVADHVEDLSGLAELIGE